MLFNKRQNTLLFFLFIFFKIFFANSQIIFAASIILDPGHSPGNPGAISCTGEREYVYNNNLVHNIFDTLSKNKIDIILSKRPLENISLTERTKDSLHKDLFISIHHDSVQPQFIKYIDGKPTSNKANGYSLFISRKNKNFNESLAYAKSIGKRLRKNGLIPSKHHGEPIKGENRQLLDKELGIYAFDDLIVLKTAKCPALLLEAGVIVNPQDERLVNTEKFHRIISDSILYAIQ